MAAFSAEQLTHALEAVGIRNVTVDTETIPGLVYVDFEDSNLKWIRAAATYDGKNNCINIYHGLSGCSKNGYWWDGPLVYEKLAEELMKYHTPHPVEASVESGLPAPENQI